MLLLGFAVVVSLLAGALLAILKLRRNGEVPTPVAIGFSLSACIALGSFAAYTFFRTPALALGTVALVTMWYFVFAFFRHRSGTHAKRISDEYLRQRALSTESLKEFIRSLRPR